MWKIFQTIAHFFQRTPPNPGDERYPRHRRIRLLRWIGIHWWQSLILLFSAFLTTYYLPIAFTNLSKLFLRNGFHGLIDVNNLTKALFPDQLLPLLERYWTQQWWLVILLAICMVLLVYLRFWAYLDQKREQVVLTLRNERDAQRREQDRLQRLFEHQSQKLVAVVDKVVEEHNKETITDIRKDLVRQGAKTVSDLGSIIEPRLPPPFDKDAAQARYLDGVLERYGSIRLPIGPTDGFSLQAVFQPLKLRRNPLAAEDLVYEKRRRLLGELRSDIDPDDNGSHGGIEDTVTAEIVVDIPDDALNKSPRGHMIVLGGPGTGKTTVLAYLIGNQARKAKYDPTAQLPIFISLPALASSGQSFQEYLLFLVKDLRTYDRYAEVLWEAVESGHAFICLDSLDEVVPKRRPEMIRLINELTHGSSNIWIIGSRFTEYKGGQFNRGQFTEWELQPLNHDLRHRLAQQLLPELHHLIPSNVVVKENDPYFFVSLLENHPQIASWGENPLLFSLAAVVFVRLRKLPARQAALYQEVIDAILGIREPDPTRQKMLCRVLTTLALELYQTKGRIFTRDDMINLLPAIRQKQYENWLTDDMINRIITSGVLDIVAHETYGFRHQTFQEYLVAAELAQQLVNPDRVMRENAWNFAWSRRTYSRWTEILRLMVGVLVENYRKEGMKLALKWLKELVKQREKAEGDPGNLGLALALKSFPELVAMEADNREEGELQALEGEIMAVWLEELLSKVGYSYQMQGGQLQALAAEVSQLDPHVVEQAVKQLIAALEDSNSWVGEAAMIALGKMRSYIPVDQIIRALGNRHSNVRKAAAHVLGTLGERAPLETLLTTLNSSNSRVRAAVLEALGYLGARAPVPHLVAALNDRNCEVRAAATMALGQLKEHAPLEPLLAALNDKEGEVRSAAVRALRQLGERAPFEPLIAALNDEDSDVREAAIWSLGYKENDVLVEWLLVALKDEDRDVRWPAVQALGDQGDRAPLEPLITALRDEDIWVREAAVRALGNLGERAPVDLLVAALNNEESLGDMNRRLRQAAVQALEQLGKHTELEHYIDSIEKNCGWVRAAVVQLLGKLGELMPVELLVSLLDDDDGPVRAMAIEALGQLGERVPLERLITTLEDKSALVRCAAVRILGERISIQQLKIAMKDNDAGVRKAAVVVLGQRKGRIPVEWLVAALDDQDAEVREAAVVALGQRKGRIQLKQLVAALDDQNIWVRREAVRVLGKLGPHMPVEAVLKTLDDSVWWVRSWAAGTLGRLGDSMPLEPLLFRALNDEEGQVRSSAVRALGKHAPVKQLVAALDNENAKLREAAVWALEGLEARTPVEQLTEMLSDENAKVREAVLWVLGTHTPVEQLVTALGDENADVRRVAAIMLGELEEQAPLKPLLRALNDEDPNARSAVAGALAKLGERVPVEPLTSFLDDEIDNVRVEIVKAIGKRAPVEGIVACLGDSDEGVREAAAAILLRWYPDTLPGVISEATVILQKKGSGLVLGSMVQGTIAETVGDMDNAAPALLLKLTELLQWPYWEVRMKAAQALGALRRNIPDPAIRRLIELRRDPQSRTVRQAAENALANILTLESGIEDDEI